MIKSPVPRKFTYEESSFGGYQYLIELQADKSLGLMVANGCLPIGIHYLDYSFPCADTWYQFRQEIQAFDYSGIDNDLVCDGTCLDLWVTYKNRIKFSAIVGSSVKLDQLRDILNPLTFCDEFPEGIFNIEINEEN